MGDRAGRRGPQSAGEPRAGRTASLVAHYSSVAGHTVEEGHYTSVAGHTVEEAHYTSVEERGPGQHYQNVVVTEPETGRHQPGGGPAGYQNIDLEEPGRRSKKVSLCSVESDPATGCPPPRVPTKGCSRSVSQVSRHSGHSGSSSRSHHSDPKYRYDEVSLSNNFNKPVLEPTTHQPHSPKVEDIFALSAVTFGSPLTDASPPSRGLLAARLAGEPGMASIESAASSGPSFLPIRPCSDSEDDDPYEDIEELKRALQGQARLAPEPPPRNSILKPEKAGDHKGRARDNIYSDLDTSGESGKGCSENLMDAVMVREDELFSDEEEGEHEYEVTDERIRQELGARPKTNGATTIDIRSKVSRWYEEAEREVERDLALDISALDSGAGPAVRRRPTRPAAYEHISLAFAGRPVVPGGEVVPRPTMTLLRDFDPCHLGEEADAVYSKEPPAPRPRKCLPATVKKINFGPPKPPRNFNYADREDEATQMCEKPLPSEPDRVRCLTLTPGAALQLEALGRDHPQARRGKDRKDSLKGKKEERVADEAVENLYVALPVHRVSDLSSDSQPSSPEESPRPPSEPPPPLPASGPPGSVLPRASVYENVWVEPALPVGPVALPPLPARPDRRRRDSPPERSAEAAVSKTHLLDALFQGRKASQESLGSPLKGRGHSKSESIDSGSSASSYSIASESPTLGSAEQLPGGPASPSRLVGKRFPANRSFSVASLGPRLTKLPEMATSIRRRMSNQFGQAGQAAGVRAGEAMEAAAIFPDTPDTSDQEQEAERGPELVAQVKKNSFVVSEALKPGTKTQAGALFILSRSKKAFQCKWCILGHGNLRWFNEDTSLAIPKETILLSNIFSVTKKTDRHIGPSQQDLFCFDISALNSKGKFQAYLLGAQTAQERETWLERLVQSLSYRLATFSMAHCYRLGWAYIKLGFAAEWSLSWLSLSRQCLRYTTLDGPDLEDINLKKTKDLFIRAAKDSKNLSLPQGFSKHPVLVCDFNDRSLYILVGAEKECQAWKAHIQEVAFNNSNVLREQQVTHEDIPVIVDKCVKFVYSHGVMTEGIYRLAGGNTKINRLLTAFRSNAWAVQISREEYSEHDVANVLKRFIRQLSEPLLTEALREEFFRAAGIQDEQEKLARYCNLLNRLPAINYNTLRRLMGHLHTVADQCDKNLMPVLNLAPLWGPNMTTVDGQEASCQQFGQTSDEMESFHAVGGVSTIVCADFLKHYPGLFNVDNSEVEKEKRMLEILEKINFPTPTSMKRSGDIRMWIYIESRTSGTAPVSLVLHPSLTAGEALRAAGEEAGLAGPALQSMQVHEVVLGGALERPLHHAEKLLDVTLRWGSWPETDRHDNYLLLKSNHFYEEALPCAVPPLSVMAEVQFSDCRGPKSKFLPFLFSVAKANITYYREEKNGIPSELGAWPVEGTSWYLGSEPRRGAPYNLNITFILKNEEVRSKEQPLFGRVMSFSSRELFVKWIAALLVAEHQQDIANPAPLLALS